MNQILLSDGDKRLLGIWRSMAAEALGFQRGVDAAMRAYLAAMAGENGDGAYELASDDSALIPKEKENARSASVS